jgi:hypothetical protein
VSPILVPGCDVIVDDISKYIRKGLVVHASQNPKLTRCQPFYSAYLEQPFFQDGVIARSANDVAEIRGIPYFSSAGNQAKNSWQGTFQGSGLRDNKGCELHAFAGGDTRQSIRFNGGKVQTVFQWEDPFFSVSGGSGASRDMDFRVYFNGTIFEQDLSNDQGIDPVAFIAINATGTFEFEFSLCTPNTTPPLMKWIAFGNVSDIEFDTQSSTSFGHPNAAFAAGVGAAFFRSTPAFGTNPLQLESFSSHGGTPILFDRSGAPTNEVRMQPRFVATDGCINTFFGQFEDIPPNGPGFYFLVCSFTDSILCYLESLFVSILLLCLMIHLCHRNLCCCTQCSIGGYSDATEESEFDSTSNIYHIGEHHH